MTIMIGIDPHKATHTAVAVDENEVTLGEFKVRASKAQVRLLCEWASEFGQREWAVESANGLGYLVARQLVAAGETVFDVSPMLASRVRVLGSGRSNKNDPNDARAVAIAAMRSAVTQFRNLSEGRVFYDRKIAEGKTHKEAIRALKRRISDRVYNQTVSSVACGKTNNTETNKPHSPIDKEACNSAPTTRLRLCGFRIE